MRLVRWGILATGNIAQDMAQALYDSADAEIVAVASRNLAKAEAFGETWNIPRRYEGYAALAQDPDVDIVYIATPHSHHHENMQLCLSAGKHVLCEKAFTSNARQAAECIALARQKGFFLMEAMWMRFFPAMQTIREWLQEDLIGDVRLIQADFCFDLPFDPEHRLYNPALSGGALLDLGIYPLSLTTMILGFPQQLRSHAQIGQTGVDELDSIICAYQNAQASLSCSMRINKPREAFILGTKGYIKIHDIFFSPEQLTLQMNGQAPQLKHYPFAGNGYIHELEEVHACLRAGKTESEIMPLDETLKLMELMDGLRAEWGVVFPGEIPK